MKILIASDHAGPELKTFIQRNYPEVDWIDLGPHDGSSVDYPDYAALLCEKLLAGEAEKGILICGTGLGMSYAANRYKGIRAAHVESSFTAKLAAEHNQANVLCLGARVTAPHYALEILAAWLNAEFGGPGASEAAKDRHRRRIEKIDQLGTNGR